MYMNNVKYSIELVDNSNLGKIIRETLHILIEGEYTLEDLYEIAKKEALKYIQNNKVNALAIGFYENKSSLCKGYEMGYVNYVPNGEWADAVNIVAGDYRNFKFVNKLHKKYF